MMMLPAAHPLKTGDNFHPSILVNWRMLWVSYYMQDRHNKELSTRADLGLAFCTVLLDSGLC